MSGPDPPRDLLSCAGKKAVLVVGAGGAGTAAVELLVEAGYPDLTALDRNEPIDSATSYMAADLTDPDPITPSPAQQEQHPRPSHPGTEAGYPDLTALDRNEPIDSATAYMAADLTDPDPITPSPAQQEQHPRPSHPGAGAE